LYVDGTVLIDNNPARGIIPRGGKSPVARSGDVPKMKIEAEIHQIPVGNSGNLNPDDPVCVEDIFAKI